MGHVQGLDGIEGTFPAVLPALSFQLQCPEVVLNSLQFFVKQHQVFLKESKGKACGDSCPHRLGSPELWDPQHAAPGPQEPTLVLQVISQEFTSQVLR